MINVEIKFVVDGHEVSLGSFAETVVREVRTAVREAISRALGDHQNQSHRSNQTTNNERLRQAVSVREAAHLLSISPRTVHKYMALKVIRTVRVGRRVLVPMKSVNEVASKGIWCRHNQKPTG
jgi:excisionase family DNA binding protein